MEVIKRGRYGGERFRWESRDEAAATAMLCQWARAGGCAVCADRSDPLVLRCMVRAAAVGQIGCLTTACRPSGIAELRDALRETRALLRREGIPCGTVSLGCVIASPVGMALAPVLVPTVDFLVLDSRTVLCEKTLHGIARAITVAHAAHTPVWVVE